MFPSEDRPLPPGYEHYVGRFSFLASQSYDQMDAQGMLLIGSPETVARKVQEHLQALDTDCFMGVFSFGTLTSAQVLASLRRFAEEVIPQVAATPSAAPTA